MKRYTFKLVIEEGGDEYWEDFEKRGVTGCEEVTELLVDSLFAVGIVVDENCTLKLEKFENNADV